MGLVNNTLDSLRPLPKATGPTILLFKNPRYGGPMRTVTEDTKELLAVGFNDFYRSAIVLDGTWTLYTGTHYKGKAVTLAPGNYPEPSLFKSDDISSLKQTGTSISVYQREDYRGRSEVRTNEVPDLKDVALDNQVSSCKIPIGSTWLLYELPNFQGKCSILESGNYATARAMKLPNNTLSSMRPFPIVDGPTVLLFKDSNFCGPMMVVRGAASDIGSDFNNKISSVIVLEGNWTAYQDIDFQGSKTELTARRYPELGSCHNNFISSLKPEVSVSAHSRIF